jgi:nucleoside-diphosphate-sugar epimerase
MELSVINPAFVLGPPVLPRAAGESVAFAQRLLSGELRESGAPSGAFGAIDVRDVGIAHINAMTRPAAAGKRFILSSSVAVTQLDVSNVLRGAGQEFWPWHDRLPTRYEDANMVDKDIFRLKFNNAQATRVLSVTPRPMEETMADMARAMVKLGLVDDLSQLLKDAKAAHAKKDEL